MNDLRSERQPAETAGWLGKVGDVMSRKFVLLSPGTRVEDALIWSEGRGAAWGVVVEDGRVAGSVAVSELAASWDVSARAASAWWSAPARLGRGQLRVADVSRTGTLVGAAESLIVALHRMDEAGADHLIVMEEDGRPAGVISRRDAIAALSPAACATPAQPASLAGEAYVSEPCAEHWFGSVLVSRREATQSSRGMDVGQAVATRAAQIGGVVGASEHEDGSTVTANTSEPVTSLSANPNTDPSSPGRTQTAAAGVSPSITHSS